MNRAVIKKTIGAQIVTKSDFKQKMAGCLYVVYGLLIKESLIKSIHLSDNGATVNTWFGKKYYIGAKKLLLYFG